MSEGIFLLRLQIEKYEAFAKAAPEGSGARKAAEEVVRLTRESLALIESLARKGAPLWK